MSKSTKRLNDSKKLNLGSGPKYMEWWINLDIGDEDIYGRKIKVDMIYDLDKFPYPFPDNYFEEILMDNVLEHLEEPMKVMRELIRICKENAKIIIRVPHFSHFKAFMDPSHKHFFSAFSIDLMKCNCELIERNFTASENHPFIRLIGRLFTSSPMFYERFLYGYFPVMENEWILKVKK